VKKIINLAERKTKSITNSDKIVKGVSAAALNEVFKYNIIS
jgi:hypothetical protein